MNKFDILFYGGIVALLAIGAALQLTDAKTETKQAIADYAYMVCSEARAEINGASEEACGKVLDKGGLTFNCNESGTRCLVESDK